MTTYTLNGTPGQYNWSDPTSWVGGVVPNAPDGDVVFPVVTMTSTGQPVTSRVQITSGAYAIRSLAVNADELDVFGGSLAVIGAVSVMPTGSLEVGVPVTVGSLSNQGTISGNGAAAQLTSTGAVTNSAAWGRSGSIPTCSRRAPPRSASPGGHQLHQYRDGGGCADRHAGGRLRQLQGWNADRRPLRRSRPQRWRNPGDRRGRSQPLLRPDLDQLFEQPGRRGIRSGERDLCPDRKYAADDRLHRVSHHGTILYIEQP